MTRKLYITGGLMVAWAIVWTAAAPAETVRLHGDKGDEQHSVFIEEHHGFVLIGVLSRLRPVGGEPVKDTANENTGESGRYTDVEFYVKLVVDVLKPAAPNNLQNPGIAYRITVKGLTLFPDYVSITYTDAANARDVVFYELNKFISLTGGIERDLLYKGASLAVKILKEQDRLPAEIYESVLLSKTGAFRITPGAQERRSIKPMEVFAPEPVTGRVEAGASMRAKDKKALPKRATSYQVVRGLGGLPVPAGPRTPAAAAAAEALEASERAEQARTGTLGRAISWAPVGGSSGFYMPDVRIEQPIRKYGR